MVKIRSIPSNKLFFGVHLVIDDVKNSEHQNDDKRPLSCVFVYRL